MPDPWRTWMVSWRYQGKPFLMDVDNEAKAYGMGMVLAEAGRTNVLVQESTIDVDDATLARIKERVAATLREAAR